MQTGLQLKRLAFLLVLFTTELAYADAEKIADVVVRGNRRIEAAAIANAVTTRPGDTLDRDKTDADIKAIYAMGQFRDVQVSTESGPKGTVLVFSVLEKTIVRDVRFEGNKEIRQDKLIEGLPVKRNAVFDQKDLDAAVTKIRRQYQDEGYYLVEITPSITKRTETEYVVTFNIVEGNKVRIGTIQFDGNKSFSPRKLRGVMETKEEWFMSWLTGAGTYKEDVLKNDSLLINDFYMNNGFINVKVGEPVVKLSENRDSLLVTIAITEGDQYRIGSISFKGDILYPEDELRKKLRTETGELFSRASIRADISTITDMTADKGYAFNNVNPQTKPDVDKKLLDVIFDVDKGDLVYIERINISGNSKTRDKVVRREMRLMEGELYSATGFKRSKQNLTNTGFFEEANIATAKGSSANKLNINVDVKEKATGAFTIGGGYSSLDGLIFQGSVSQSNFMGLGLKANLSASIGGKTNTYNVGLTDPYFLDSKWTLGVDIYRSERNYTDYSRRLTGGDIKAGYPLSDFLGTFWMYKYEIKDLYNPDYMYLINNMVDSVYYPLGTTTTSSIFGSLNYNSTDYRLDPNIGMQGSVSVEYAGLGGNNKYVREIAEGTVFYPLWWKFVASTKLVIGGVQRAGKPIPIDEKFYLGGLGTVRGYAARTISPIQDGVYIGGDKEVFGNLEIKFPILPEYGIKGVTFFDYGNAYNGNDLLPKKLYTSYGAGIRWASPVGPLRLEYGIPINPRPGVDTKSGRFEFAIGSLF